MNVKIYLKQKQHIHTDTVSIYFNPNIHIDDTLFWVLYRYKMFTFLKVRVIFTSRCLFFGTGRNLKKRCILTCPRNMNTIDKLDKPCKPIELSIIYEMFHINIKWELVNYLNNNVYIMHNLLCKMTTICIYENE